MAPQHQWRKSSYSSHTGDDCVEAASLHAVTAVRDTKDRSRGCLEVPCGSWALLLAAVCAP
ncbi:DUF397 domain-containing protein [Streptomyces sp. SID3343]|nr:DUF397 domain-containing protein [Streptomyces sp. SID3343]